MVMDDIWSWRRSPLQERYEEWRATPDGQVVYQYIRDAALRLHRRGWRHYGVKALAEAARYEWSLQVGPDVEGFRVNNNWTSRLARDLMANEPALVGFFELRELRA